MIYGAYRALPGDAVSANLGVAIVSGAEPRTPFLVFGTPVALPSQIKILDRKYMKVYVQR